MKLIDKETGEIGKLLKLRDDDDLEVMTDNKCYRYKTLAEVVEHWEDYEEPETFWYISPTGTPIKSTTSIYDPLEIHLMKKIGNYFESEEDADDAVEKLKTLTRLCRKGFEFNGVEMFGSGLIRIEASIPINEKTTLQERSDITDDLDLLFGGEDDYEPTNAEINDLTDMGCGG